MLISSFAWYYNNTVTYYILWHTKPISGEDSAQGISTHESLTIW